MGMCTMVGGPISAKKLIQEHCTHINSERSSSPNTVVTGSKLTLDVSCLQVTCKVLQFCIFIPHSLLSGCGFDSQCGALLLAFFFFFFGTLWLGLLVFRSSSSASLTRNAPLPSFVLFSWQVHRSTGNAGQASVLT